MSRQSNSCMTCLEGHIRARAAFLQRPELRSIRLVSHRSYLKLVSFGRMLRVSRFYSSLRRDFLVSSVVP